MTAEVASIPEWFRGRSVFVTGGTGFMGKVLVYKLLSSCHDLGNIFLLVREKRGTDPRSRLYLMLQQLPFKVLKEKYPEQLKKIVLVSGDTASPDLGLSASDKERLSREVSVVFHMAANVKFDMTLKEAIKSNTQGTANVLAFAKQMSNLQSFIHVSTTYCQCNEEVLEEQAYPASIDPESIITTVNKMSDEVLVAMTPKLIGNQPNTYAFSKALSEDLVQRCGLPAGVARPSIVTASWKEPVTGWVENINGPTGIMIGAGKGVIRTFLCNEQYLMDVIPCDMAINAIIALAWKVGRENPVKPIFMNVTNENAHSLSWGDAIEKGRRHAIANPFTGLLWYPGGRTTTSKVYHRLMVILLHLIPAYFLDTVIAVTGNKPFLVKVQQKITMGLKLLNYYTMKQWCFRTNRILQLEEELHPSDREEFYMNTRVISWDDYILSYILGTRQYFLKDDPSTLPRARRVITYLYYADWFVKIALLILAGWFLYGSIMSFANVTTTMINSKYV